MRPLTANSGLALQRFKETYNRTWIVERHGYQTPAVLKDQPNRAVAPAAARDLTPVEPIVFGTY